MELGAPADTADGAAEIAEYADRTWIINSRNTADEDLILAGYGVGLLPTGATWPPLRTRLDRMPPPGTERPRPKWPRPVPAV